MGHELHLLLLHPTYDTLPARDRDFVKDGVRVAHVAQMHVYGLPGSRRYFGASELARVSFHAARALSQQAMSLKPHVIHICKPQPINGAAGWFASRQSGLPYFVDCDDYEAEANRVSSSAQRAVIRWFEDTLPSRAAGVTVNTRFLQQRNESLGVLPTRIAYVPNGADPIALDPNVLPSDIHVLQGKPVVLYLGTLSTVAHGVDILLRAFPQVLARVPNTHLLMVGDGDDRTVLHALAGELGIQHAITWTGRVPADQARAYFAVATCSIDPVHDSPAARGRSPLKIVESLAAGVPVVTGDVGDRRDMLADGAAGVLVTPGDAAALAEGITRVLLDAPLRERLAQGALRQRRHFGWHTLAQTWAKLYDDYLGNSV